MLSIDNNKARQIALSRQLLHTKSAAKDKPGLLNIIKQIGYVQIDTISIIERAHHHTLWLRMPAYNREMLRELMEDDREVFEYWSHAAAYLPIADYRFTHYRKEKFRTKYKSWFKYDKKIVRFVLDRIRAEGPLQSKDFEHKAKDKRGGWWNWKPAKEALEYLFHEGTLMVSSRRGFQKVYDLTERVLPAGIDTSMPTAEQYTEHLIINAIRAHGFASPKEITYLRHFEPKILKYTLRKMTEAGMIEELKIGNASDVTYYCEPGLSDYVSELSSKQLHILSPFDNLIVQRKRLKNIFDFDFNVEFYLPAHKRTYGYFSMPVLYGTEFIARIDAKADRAAGNFEVINYFPEKGSKPKGDLKALIRNKITALASFAGCEKVRWNRKI